ncbi:hypothetical protein D3C71_1502660 [compost metagenome]
MHAEGHQRGPDRADHETGDGRAQVIEGVVDAADGTANEIADGAEGQQGQGHHDGETEHGGEQVAHHHRQVPLEEALHIGHGPDHQDDGDHRGRVAQVLHRQTEEAEWRAVEGNPHQVDDGLVDGWVLHRRLHQRLHRWIR